MIKDKEYYDNLDKRTKEYKEWVLSQDLQPHTPKESEGLGDTIAKITKATGIDKLVKFIAGEDCGCDERRKKLNEKFAYSKKVNCLVEEDYNWLKTFYDSKPNSIKPSEQRTMNEIHKRVFGYEEGTCDGCIRAMNNNLKVVFDSYGE